jgi:aldehyde dehydrogenase
MTKKIECMHSFTEEKIGEIPTTPLPDIKYITDKARSAQKKLVWLSLEQRKNIITSMLDAIEKNAERLAELTTLETGLPIKDARGLVTALVERSKWFVDNAEKFLAPDVTDIGNDTINEIRYEPLGVVAVISSWNAPLSQTVWCATPAILAGNTVVHKPSEFSSLCSQELQRIFDKASIPEGIFQTIYGYKEEGEVLVENADLISFAGSVTTGQAIIARAAQNMSRVCMELGGKDIMLVLADADVDSAVAAAVKGSNKHCGQSCNAVEVLYVDPSLYDSFIEKAVEEIKKLEPDDPMKESTVLGPLANKSSFDKVTAMFNDAKAKGATIVYGGGKMNAKGFAFRPALVKDVTDDMLIMKEEIFGPILPIKKLENINRVIDEVNDSQYGLGFSVWSTDIEKAKKIASQVMVGTAVVNGLPRTNINAPWGGMRKSGIGRILSPIGMRVFTEPKNLRYPKGVEQ